jgi:hypothetical protein
MASSSAWSEPDPYGKNLAALSGKARSGEEATGDADAFWSSAQLTD